MELGFKDTYAGVEACMNNNLASIIHGSPAVGKSGVYKKLAEEHNLEFIDIRLTQFDPVDLSGLPIVTNGRADYALPNVFPLKGDKLPKGKKAFLLCHHKDTEVLTKDRGFVLFKDLAPEEKVAQFDMKTNEITYAKPEAYVAYHKKGKLVDINNKTIQACITEDHDLIIESKAEDNNGLPIKRYKRKPMDVSLSGSLCIPMAGIGTGKKDVLTLEDKLIIAAQADGSFDKPYADNVGSLKTLKTKTGIDCIAGHKRIEFGFSKKRKYKLFKKTFSKLEGYKRLKDSQYENRNDMRRYVLHNIAPELCTKNLRDIFNPSDFSQKGAREFLDWVKEWDGWKVPGYEAYGYCSTNKASVDLVQEMVLLAGYYNHYYENKKENYVSTFKVSWYKNKKRATTQVLSTRKLIEYDDMVYCLKMPKATLITRYKDRTLISGNCFEEIQDCAPMVQGAAYRIILDRMINDVPLHEKCFIGATSNLITDGGITRKMLPAMASRFIHYNMAPVLDEWLAWASKEGIDPMLLSAIEYNDEIFYNFNPEFVGSTYASPRSWEFASKLIAGKDKLNSKDLINLIGAVGDAAARQVLAYYEENNNIPSIKEILKNPERVEIPYETSKVYALGNRVASLVDKNNAKKMMKLVRKFDMEFQLSIMMKIIARDETLLSLPSIDKWHEKNSDLVTD